MFYTSLEEHETVAFLKVEIMTQEDLDKIRSGGVVKLLICLQRHLLQEQKRSS